MGYESDFKIETDRKEENVWEKKDRRIARMNALSTATKIVEIVQLNKTPELSTADNMKKKELTADKLAEVVVFVAKRLEHFIYEGE